LTLWSTRRVRSRHLRRGERRRARLDLGDRLGAEDRLPALQAFTKLDPGHLAALSAESAGDRPAPSLDVRAAAGRAELVFHHDIHSGLLAETRKSQLLAATTRGMRSRTEPPIVGEGVQHACARKSSLSAWPTVRSQVLPWGPRSRRRWCPRAPGMQRRESARCRRRVGGS
jgi:hypothetical protein